MSKHTYRTVLNISTPEALEQELRLRLTFKVWPGCSPTLEQPGESASAELLTAEVEVAPTEWAALPEWLFGILYSDRELEAEMLASAAEDDEYARDQAADARREELSLRTSERS